MPTRKIRPDQDQVQNKDEITIEGDITQEEIDIDVEKYMLAGNVDSSAYIPRQPGEFTVGEFMEIAARRNFPITEETARKMLIRSVRVGKLTQRIWIGEGKRRVLYREVTQ